MRSTLPEHRAGAHGPSRRCAGAHDKDGNPITAKSKTRTAALTAAGALTAAALAAALPAQAAPTNPAAHRTHGVQVAVFTAGGAHTGPDDLTTLDSHVFVAYQNGVGSIGEAAPSGATRSTVIEYTRHGKQLASWQLIGKVDGRTADAVAGEVGRRAGVESVFQTGGDAGGLLAQVRPGCGIDLVPGQQRQRDTECHGQHNDEQRRGEEACSRGSRSAGSRCRAP